MQFKITITTIALLAVSAIAAPTVVASEAKYAEAVTSIKAAQAKGCSFLSKAFSPPFPPPYLSLSLSLFKSQD
jgi:hypothetical protein